MYWCIQFRYFDRPYKTQYTECKMSLLGMKRLLQENYLTGWSYILEMKACTIMPIKLCTISDYGMRNICKNV